MPIDGRTFPLNYVGQRVFLETCQLFQPERPIGADGDPRTVNWSLAVDLCPFHNVVRPRQRRLDEDMLAGRFDPDGRAAMRSLYFPLQTPLDEGWWVRDVTVVDGVTSEDFGLFYVVRTTPRRWHDRPFMECGHLFVGVSTERVPPKGIAALIGASLIGESLIGA